VSRKTIDGNTSQEKIAKIAHELLDAPFWLQELDTTTEYSRLHDDHDGSGEGRIAVSIDGHGDIYFHTDVAFKDLRFRTHAGGGRSLRTRTALLLLALAIKLDGEERPDPTFKKNKE